MPRTPLALTSLAEMLLPPPIDRWTPMRKAAVVAAITLKWLTPEEACRRYQLHPEEITRWTALLERHGLEGLRSTRVQAYRRGTKKADRKRPA